MNIPPAAARLLIGLATIVMCFHSTDVSAQILRPRIDSVPASQVPPQYAPTDLQQRGPIDVTGLRQLQQETYTLAADDILGVFVEGVLGAIGENPPVQFPPAGSSLKPGIGYPIPVRADGTLWLPLIAPLPVAGLTLSQAEDLIKRAYTSEENRIVNPDTARIIVSLLRKRTYNVIVLREDNAGSAQDMRINNRLGVTSRSDQSSRGSSLQMEAGQNDLLNALIETGGLPGLNAEDEIRIYRTRKPPLPSSSNPNVAAADDFPRATDSSTSVQTDPYQQSFSYSRNANRASATYGQVAEPRDFGSDLNDRGQYGHASDPYSRIAYAQSIGVRGGMPGYGLAPNRSTRNSSAQASLRDGDVVYVDAKPTEVYYTGGLLGGGEFPIPRDQDLDVLEAVAIAGGPITGGGGGAGGIPSLPPTELIVLRRQQRGGQQIGNGQVAIRVDLNRTLNDPAQRILVAPGDTLILRYKTGEAIGNFGIGAFNNYGLRQLLR